MPEKEAKEVNESRKGVFIFGNHSLKMIPETAATAIYNMGCLLNFLRVIHIKRARSIDGH